MQGTLRIADLNPAPRGPASIAVVPLGLAIAGPLADALGVRFWFVVGVVMAAMGMGTLFVPAITHIQERANQRELSARTKRQTDPRPRSWRPHSSPHRRDDPSKEAFDEQNSSVTI